MLGLVVAALCAIGESASAGAEVERDRVHDTPIQKVVQLLDGMVAKGKQEKHNEEEAFAKFHEWCDSTRASTTKSIAEATSQIEQLTADIAKAEADAEELAADIKQLEGNIAQAEVELKEARAERKKENEDYSATHRDFSESIDAIERAVQVLKSRERDVPQSLLQVRDSPRIPREAKAAIESFLAMSSGSELAVPEANAYDFQSGGVVAVLEKLRLKFQDQRLSLQKEEMNAKANFELLAQKLIDNITEDKKIVSKKTAVKAQRLADAAAAKGELKNTEAGKAEDEKTLSDTLAVCHAKSEEFEKNQVVRAEEVKAILKAIEILQSDEVSGTAAKHLPTLVQVSRVAQRTRALVQLRGKDGPEEAQRRQHVVEFLQGRAKHLGSRYLSLVATHASADPFAKVKKMIKDLIVKLMEQANSEADHKAFCDTELATNKQTREIKQSEVDELSASIEKHLAKSAQLAEELAELSDAVAELRRQQAEAAKLRESDKATNAQTVEEAKAAQAAVERATQVLKEFYATAAEATLLQGGVGLRQEMAQAAQAPYKGMQSESGGIMGFLEVILSDFARLQSETESSEDRAAAAYEKFMDESTQDIAVKETEMGHKTSNREDTDARTASLKKELELTQGELDAALAYYDKLKPDCLDHNLSYSERVQMREEEIQSLKEALQMLNQQDLD